MSKSEQLDAILHWLAAFQTGLDDFLADPLTLLNGQVLSSVYNSVSNDQIESKSLKPVSSESDWVNALLNMRTIIGRMAGTLKENGITVTAELNALTRKRSTSELTKFLKFFLFYCVKSPEARKSLELIHNVDTPFQIQLQSILAEFLKKDNPLPVTADPKLTALQSELANLQRKAADLSASLTQQKAQRASVEAPAADLRISLQSAISVRDELRRAIDECESSTSEMSARIAEWRAAFQPADNFGGAHSISELDAQLSLQKQKVRALIGRADTDDPRTLVDALDFAARRADIQALRSSVDGLAREISRRKAEADALRVTLAQQNQRASFVMLKRIAQLNAEMDQSPLGEAKRTSFKYRKSIQKLRGEIESTEKEGGSIEVGAFETEVQLMAERKAAESDHLAKKLSFMQATAEQCGTRLQRMNVHVELQMHRSRLKKWKSCFV